MNVHFVHGGGVPPPLPLPLVRPDGLRLARAIRATHTYPFKAPPLLRHCEERSDAAIHLTTTITIGLHPSQTGLYRIHETRS